MNTTVSLPGYDLIEQLYHGSRTIVYRGIRQTNEPHPVVVKFLQRDYPSFSELLQFRNQYTITRTLNLPGVICPYGLEAYGNSYALVMEDFGGISLRTYAQSHPLSLAEGLAIALQLADILHDIHQHRVIHKDIKPANILIHPESRQIKLIDFSIASLLPRETEEVKHPTVLEGTLAYLSPEQTGRMNRGIDYRTDFYALGITLFELLTRELPFQSNDPLELVHCHIAKPAPSVCDVKPELPAIIGRIVAKLMAKNAEDRYQSALGLKHDLEQCLKQLETIGTIEEFELASRDVGDRFLIPETLYGREAEVGALLDAFDRTASSQTPTSELMLVAGFSGIGKTAVVNEVHKPIVKQRGYFIKGKFDQLNRNLPFSAFVQAFRDLMGQLLSESDAQLQSWRSQILNALGDNGQVIVEVIPELERIIGTQPPILELSGNAAQNRFHWLFQTFIQVFTTPAHPLVIFLDDLQWADSASLNLIQRLMTESKLGHLLVIGTYRDNEVFAAHPLMTTLDEIRTAGATVNTLTLQPLQPPDLNHLIADTFHCTNALAQPLTELVYQKTQGNPFFATQFLKALHDDQYIQFNPAAGCWQCNLTPIKAQSLTEDVMEFMGTRLQKLPEATQHMLQFAACIGAQFDLQTLAIVSEQSEITTAAVLWKALQEGFVVPLNESYKFFQDEEGLNSPYSSITIPYRFLHDRVQQTAYSLIPDPQKQAKHFQIGQLLLARLSPTEQEERIFEIVNQLNYGEALVTDPQGREQIAQFNLLAGRKAKLSAAYESAYKYFTQGQAFLTADRWESQYRLTVDLQIGAAEAACLNTDYDRMKAIVDGILTHSTDLQDRVQVHELLILYHHTQSQFREAVELAVQTLANLGESFPDKPDTHAFVEALNRTTGLIAQVGWERLDRLPPMEDPQKLAAMRILRWSCYPAYFAVPEMLGLLVCRLVDLTLTYGHSPLTPFAYGIFSVLMNGGVGNIEMGSRFGELAIALEHNQPTLQYRAVTYNACYGLSRHFYRPVRECIDPLLEGYQSFADNGDAESSAYCLINAYFCSILSGQNLKDVQHKFEKYIQQVVTFKQEQVIHQLHVWTQFMDNLTQGGQPPSLLQGHAFDIDEKLPHLYKTKNFNTINYVHTAQALLAYTFEDYECALAHAQETEPLLGASTGKFFTSIHNFYYSLSLLALYEQSSEDYQHYILNKLHENQEKLNVWVESCPANFAHKYRLVQAEIARITQQRSEAIEFYDRAIAGAKASGYLQEEALGNELAAKFYLSWGKEKVAAGYLQEAYYGYARWGANAKTADLEARYPALLRPILHQAMPPFSVLETLASIAAPIHTIPSTSHPTLSHTSLSQSLDLATLLQVSQALSSTIQMDELLQTLTQTMLENSGADRCALILSQAGEWQVRVIADLDRTTLQSDPLDDTRSVPVKLIQYVKNTLEGVVIHDLKTDLPGVISNYLQQHQPKSVLCLPFLNQNQLVGILYLENQGTRGVFTSDRLLVLNFLASQAAIALENARLYHQVQQTLMDLQQAQVQIVQSEKMSSLGNLVAGVAHEINNPVNFIHGNLTYLNEYTQDLLRFIEHCRIHAAQIPQLDALAEELDLNFLVEDLQKMIASMRMGTDRIRQIVLSLRNFSRLDEADLKPVNIHEGIDNTLVILHHRLKARAERPEIEVIKEYGELPPIECYAGQLNQVFMNILVNAIDALDEASEERPFAEMQANPNRITIRTRLVDSDQIQIHLIDNGPGMSEAIQQRIFNPMFTTKPVGKGTGLGLAIAHQIVVEKHRGTIEVQSTLGVGTEFILSLSVTACLNREGITPL